MINLPKPSQLRIKGTYDEKINYLTNYITTLVTALEQVLIGTKDNNKSDDSVVVKNVSVANNKLIVFFTDGSERKFDL